MMNQIIKWVVCDVPFRSLQMRYQNYRNHGTSRYASCFTVLLYVCGWIFLRLDTPEWRWVYENHNKWYPQINLNKPKSGDVFRFVLQSLYIMIVNEEKIHEKNTTFAQSVQKFISYYYRWIHVIVKKLEKAHDAEQRIQKLFKFSPRIRLMILWCFCIFAAFLFVITITQPFDPIKQFIFIFILWWTAMTIRHLPGRGVIIMLSIISILVTCRYIWWRIHSTLSWNDSISMFFGILLLVAELYIWVILILGYFQCIWPLHRMPVPLPDDVNTWPHVDVFITTYNEDISVIKPGVLAALGINWPKEKIHIYLLDDGNRPEVKAFAEDLGIHYIARKTHEHAKAGNINHALKLTHSEFVAIFDCDHIPTHTFLQLTMGWFFKEQKLAMVQTPHHFFSPDPFERNLGAFQQSPNESALFYGLVQDGNDLWNATYFCGSSGIIRRKPLEEIGGFAVESVTEDAHTSLRMQRKGYATAYIRIPLAAGLATESLSVHVGQRIRWARGMIQIFRLDNPLLGKGLTWPQRLCYFNAMLHFLSGIPRLIFFIIPAAFILLKAYIFYAPALMLVLYAIPHLVHSVIANSRMQGRYRHFLWNEIFETVMAWYIAIPTTVALINPRKGTFNVTAKGGLVEERFADWRTAKPYLILISINLLALFGAVVRILFGDPTEVSAVALTTTWLIYNLIILGGAMGVDVEARQVRRSHRVDFSMPAVVIRSDGHAFPCTLNNYSDSGVGIEFKQTHILSVDEKVQLVLTHDEEEYAFPCDVARVIGYKAGLQLDEMSNQQHVEFIQCTFARADTWALWQQNFTEDRPLESLLDVFSLDLKGYVSMIEFTPPWVRTVLSGMTDFVFWVISFLPKTKLITRKKPVKPLGVLQNLRVTTR